MFESIQLHTWRQFKHVEVNFHPRLTILTGANGAGKTTILHLLNRHWGWNLQYVSTPRFSKQGQRKYWTGFWSEDASLTSEEELPEAPSRHIGELRYTTGQSARLSVPESASEVFTVNIDGQQSVQGVYVPSHRPLYVHQKVEQIPTQLDARQQLFEVYLNELRGRYSVNHRVQSPNHRIKQALISLATFGFGNEAVEPNQEAIETFRGFEAILKTILPPTLRFERISIRVPDVLLQTASGPFAFDAVSGGVAALIDVGWQVYMYSLLHDEFVVVIDEPEAHLHPELQQTVLPNLLKAFPKAQFIVATHNPFVIGSTADSNVYVLNYDDSGKVSSTLLDMINKAGSSNEILREVLGLSHAVPHWVQQRLEAIVAKYAVDDLDPSSFAVLRSEMAEIGLERYFPETLADVLETRK